jgi:hypothetical protein
MVAEHRGLGGSFVSFCLVTTHFLERRPSVEEVVEVKAAFSKNKLILTRPKNRRKFKKNQKVFK